jgi:hypothetical protein
LIAICHDLERQMTRKLQLWIRDSEEASQVINRDGSAIAGSRKRRVQVASKA